jgi:hypothetical protein
VDNLSSHKGPSPPDDRSRRGKPALPAALQPPTSTRLRTPSPSSKRSCARPQNEPSTGSGIGSITDRFTPTECRNYFIATGYTAIMIDGCSKPSATNDARYGEIIPGAKNALGRAASNLLDCVKNSSVAVRSKQLQKRSTRSAKLAYLEEETGWRRQQNTGKPKLQGAFGALGLALGKIECHVAISSLQWNGPVPDDVIPRGLCDSKLAHVTCLHVVGSAFGRS